MTTYCVTVIRLLGSSAFFLVGKRQGGLAKKLYFPSSFVFPPEQGHHTPACVYESLWTVEVPRGIGLSAALLLLCFFLSHCIVRVCVCVCVCGGRGVGINTRKSHSEGDILHERVESGGFSSAIE